MTTMDEAREALLATVLDPDAYDTEIRQRIDALEATIRAEYGDGADDHTAYGIGYAAGRADAEANLRALRDIIDEPCPFCGDATTLGCPESSHSIRSRLRAALAATPAEEERT